MMLRPGHKNYRGVYCMLPTIEHSGKGKTVKSGFQEFGGWVAQDEAQGTFRAVKLISIVSDA